MRGETIKRTRYIELAQEDKTIKQYFEFHFDQKTENVYKIQ